MPVTERADAVRNRTSVLAAAEQLFAREDLDHISLAQVAAAAGVGKATVLRRFGGLGGLIEAVISPRVTELQHAIHAGPAPLGPGGAPEARLRAYLDALLDFVLVNRTLIRALEHRGPHAYYANPVSQFWINELRRRIQAARPDQDAEYLAHALFTSVRADVIDYLGGHQRISTERIRAGLHGLAGIPPPD